MEIYLLRHGIAIPPGKLARDSERPLTDDGRERLTRVTRAWDALGIVVDQIFTSPHVRAWESAKIAGAALGIADRVERVAALAPGATPTDIVDALIKRCEEHQRVMLVGHEPDLGRLISTLVCGDDDAGFRIKKGGLSKLVVDNLCTGRCAVLEWHLWPRHMLRMS